MKGLIQIIVKFRTEKNICACFYHPHQTQTSFWMWWGRHKILCTKYCVAVVTVKRKELTVYIFLKESKFAILQIAKTQFRYTIWFGISEKSIVRYKFLHCGAAHMCQKSQQARHNKKNFVPEFPTFQSLKITFMCTCGFYRYEHV